MPFVGHPVIVALPVCAIGRVYSVIVVLPIGVIGIISSILFAISLGAIVKVSSVIVAFPGYLVYYFPSCLISAGLCFNP